MHHRQALGLFAGFALCPLCASTVFGETPTRARIGATKARPGLTSGVLSARLRLILGQTATAIFLPKAASQMILADPGDATIRGASGGGQALLRSGSVLAGRINPIRARGSGRPAARYHGSANAGLRPVPWRSGRGKQSFPRLSGKPRVCRAPLSPANRYSRIFATYARRSN